MAISSSELQAKIDALDEAILTGAKTINIGSSQTTFRSMREMKIARQHAQELLSAASAATASPRHKLATFEYSDE